MSRTKKAIEWYVSETGEVVETYKPYQIMDTTFWRSASGSTVKRPIDAKRKVVRDHGDKGEISMRTLFEEAQ